MPEDAGEGITTSYCATMAMGAMAGNPTLHGRCWTGGVLRCLRVGPCSLSLFPCSYISLTLEPFTTYRYNQTGEAAEKAICSYYQSCCFGMDYALLRVRLGVEGTQDVEAPLCSPSEPSRTPTHPYM